MAATRPIPQALVDVKVDLKFRTLAASMTIPQGTLAVNDAGAAKAFTDTLYAAGAGLLGCSSETYANTTGSSVTTQMLFFRNTPIVLPKGKAGDLPTAALVGKAISIADNETAKATIGVGDISVVLLEIIPGSGGYRVMLP